MLEVCLDSLESANNAINAGADEIEICSALNDGGLTPSLGLVFEILALVKKHPVHERPKVNVLIRCRGGDDFFYTELEMQHMLSDVEIFKDMGVDQFVFGALTDHREVDESKCMRFLAAAAPNKVTFSRAFDLSFEPRKSASILSGLGFYRVLTSGSQANVMVEGATELLAYLVSKYSTGRDRLVIMPGGGVTPRNVHMFINMGCQIVHSSCRSAVQLPPIERLYKLGVSDSDCVYYSDYDIIMEMKEAIATARQNKGTQASTSKSKK